MFRLQSFLQMCNMYPFWIKYHQYHFKNIKIFRASFLDVVTIMRMREEKVCENNTDVKKRDANLDIMRHGSCVMTASRRC